MKKTIFLLIMTLLLAGGAAAQLGSKQAAKNALPVEPPVNTQTENFQGMESAGGTMDVLSNLYRGYSLVFLSSDRVNPTSVTVTLDYAPTEVPGSYQVVSGQWTLVVFEDGNYVGTLFGDIPGGVIYDEADVECLGCVSRRAFNLDFRITGGMGRYENTEAEPNPSGSFRGFVDYTNGRHAEGSLVGIL